jgi:alpha-methylacyl-CoA racemase
MAQLQQHLANADLLLEGFRPGVLERLGLAPATLLAQYPRLVIGRLSGWGTHGALTERAGHDINYLALCGILNAIGTKQTPVPPLNVVGDFGGGAMHLLLGVLAKLVQRGINGNGGLVETSILAGSVGLTYMFYGMIESGLWQLGRESNLLDGAAPFYRVYATSDQRYVAVGAIEAKFYLELLQVMELGHEVDAGKQYAKDTWGATIAAFTRRFAQLPRDEWARRAASKDCCLAPVLDFTEAAADAHNRANRLYRDQPFAQPDTTIWFDRHI